MAAIEHVARAAAAEVDEQVSQDLQVGPQDDRRGHRHLLQADGEPIEFVSQMATAHEHVGS